MDSKTELLALIEKSTNAFTSYQLGNLAGNSDELQADLRTLALRAKSELLTYIIKM